MAEGTKTPELTKMEWKPEEPKETTARPMGEPSVPDSALGSLLDESEVDIPRQRVSEVDPEHLEDFRRTLERMEAAFAQVSWLPAAGEPGPLGNLGESARTEGLILGLEFSQVHQVMGAHNLGARNTGMDVTGNFMRDHKINTAVPPWTAAYVLEGLTL